MYIEERKMDSVATLIKETKRPVIIFICKKNLATRILISPILKDLQYRYKEKIFFHDIKDEVSAKLKKQYVINRYPTFLFFKKGVLVHKLEGFVNRRKLFSRVKELIEDNPVQQKV